MKSILYELSGMSCMIISSNYDICDLLMYSKEAYHIKAIVGAAKYLKVRILDKIIITATGQISLQAVQLFDRFIRIQTTVESS